MTGEAVNALSKQVLDAAFAVHTELGPGLLESTYVACLKYEVEKRGLVVLAQVPVSVVYDGHQLVDVGYRMDLLVSGELVVEGEKYRSDWASPSGATAFVPEALEEASWTSAQLQCRAPAGRDCATGERALVQKEASVHSSQKAKKGARRTGRLRKGARVVSDLCAKQRLPAPDLA